jgi:hypothetical protein
MAHLPFFGFKEGIKKKNIGKLSKKGNIDN